MALCAALVAAPAAAQDAETPPGDGWSFRITPYLWVAGVQGSGSSSRGEPSFEIDKDFTEVLGDLDFAAMVAFEARRDRFGLIADVIYLDLSAEASTPFGLIFSNVDARLSAFVGTAYGGYRFIENDRAAFDLLAGARLFSLDLDVDFEAGRFGHDRSFDASETWADPVVGVRGSFELVDDVFLSAGLDFGGFGVASDFTWQGLATVDYRFSENWLARIGYRHLAVDYAYLGDRNIDLDIAFSGPIIGISYGW